jgi:hypothetical protein
MLYNASRHRAMLPLSSARGSLLLHAALSCLLALLPNCSFTALCLPTFSPAARAAISCRTRLSLAARGSLLLHVLPLPNAALSCCTRLSLAAHGSLLPHAAFSYRTHGALSCLLALSCRTPHSLHARPLAAHTAHSLAARVAYAALFCTPHSLACALSCYKPLSCCTPQHARSCLRLALL